MTRIPARSARVRRTTAALLLPLSLTVLAGCGDSEGEGTATEPQALSSGEATAPGGEAEAPEVPQAGESIDPADFAERLFEGFTSGGTATTSMTSEALGAEITAEGVVDYTIDPPELAMVMPDFLGMGEQVEARMVDGRFYMNMGELTGGKFAVIDLDEDTPFGPDFSKQLDPRAALESFQAAAVEAVYVGEEDLEGEATQLYRLKLDAEKLMDELGVGGGQAPVQLPDEIDYQVWLGAADGFLRRMELDMGELGTTVMELSNWGEPVEIEAPPASETTDLPDVFGGAAGGTTLS